MAIRRRPYVLVTGFEPYGGVERNPSGELAVELATMHDLPARIEAEVLPVVFRKAGARIRARLLEEPPDIVLLLGLAWGAKALTFERLGINLFAGGPDNEGGTFEETSIVSGAPAAYFATIPVRDVLARLDAEGVPARESFFAGRYCCNEVLFTALHVCAERSLGTRVGFVHLPRFPEQGERDGGVARDVQRNGLRLTLSLLVEQWCAQVDVRWSVDDGG